MKSSDAKVYKQVLDTQDHCALCGSQNESQLVMHHILFGAGGRKTYLGNIVRLCNTCHIKVHQNDKHYRPILVRKVEALYGVSQQQQDID